MNVRQVIFHLPGPAWEPGLLLLQRQVGVLAHRQHYAQLHAEGKLEMGGPFLDGGGGGMMIAVEGVDAEELEAFARADPTVQSGLLTFEIRPWFIGMQR